MATISGINPSFTGQPMGGEPPYARLPEPRKLFASRARRFTATAPGSEIGDYLTFLAQVCEAQAHLADTLPTPPMPDVLKALAHGMPPLARDLALAPASLAVLDALLERLKAAPLAAGPAAIVTRLAAVDPDERRAMLIAVADGLYEVERLAESALVAAALQVWYALHAAQLDAAVIRKIEETVCPCCGGAPASSMVVNWSDAQAMRFLACSLCQTMWNHVRVKCTACGATKGISYRTVEGTDGAIGAEVCDTCHGYAKHLSLTKNPHLDPVADDVASFGLDLMLRDEGWRRTGIDPFLILP